MGVLMGFIMQNKIELVVRPLHSIGQAERISFPHREGPEVAHPFETPPENWGTEKVPQMQANVHRPPIQPILQGTHGGLLRPGAQIRGQVGVEVFHLS